MARKSKKFERNRIKRPEKAALALDEAVELILNFEGEAEGIETDRIIDEIIEKTSESSAA